MTRRELADTIKKFFHDNDIDLIDNEETAYDLVDTLDEEFSLVDEDEYPEDEDE